MPFMNTLGSTKPFELRCPNHPHQDTMEKYPELVFREEVVGGLLFILRPFVCSICRYTELYTKHTE